MDKTYEFNAVIQRVSDQDGAYVAMPFDIKAEFGKGIPLRKKASGILLRIMRIIWSILIRNKLIETFQ